MATWKHRLTNVDIDTKRAECAHCGPTTLSLWTTKGKLQRRCANARRADRKRAEFPYRSEKKDYCEEPTCTSTIVHSCQLDVDHIDNNHDNNDPPNLKTLCANCHRLKTYKASLK